MMPLQAHSPSGRRPSHLTGGLPLAAVPSQHQQQFGSMIVPLRNNTVISPMASAAAMSSSPSETGISDGLPRPSLAQLQQARSQIECGIDVLYSDQWNSHWQQNYQQAYTVTNNLHIQLDNDLRNEVTLHRQAKAKLILRARMIVRLGAWIAKEQQNTQVLQQEKRDLTARVKTLEQARTNIEEKHAETLAAKEKELDAERQEHTQTKAKLKKATADYEDLRGDLTTQRTAHEGLQKEADEAVVARNNAQTERDTAVTQCNTAVAERDELEVERDYAEKERDEAKEELDIEKEKVKKAKKLCDALRAEADDYKKCNGKLANQLAEKDVTLEQLRSEINSVKARRRDAQDQAGRLSKDIELLKKKYAEVDKSCTAGERALAQEKSNVKSLHDQQDKLQSQLDLSEAEVTKLMAALKEKEDELRELQDDYKNDRKAAAELLLRGRPSTKGKSVAGKQEEAADRSTYSPRSTMVKQAPASVRANSTNVTVDCSTATPVRKELPPPKTPCEIQSKPALPSPRPPPTGPASASRPVPRPSSLRTPHIRMPINPTKAAFDAPGRPIPREQLPNILKKPGTEMKSGLPPKPQCPQKRKIVSNEESSNCKRRRENERPVWARKA